MAAVALSQPKAPVAADGTIGTAVVAENSHRLDAAEDGSVTFTEFVDFECEVCGAVYPFVEELREDYAGEVTFVTRYFPLPGHFNSRNAAIAVEAAAEQGKFEDMYHRMFRTQAEWGEQQVSKADLFRQFAQEIGLDMTPTILPSPSPLPSPTPTPKRACNSTSMPPLRSAPRAPPRSSSTTRWFH